MNEITNGIEVLLAELQRRADIISRRFHRLGTSKEGDWPRDDEYRLIELLVEEREYEVLGDKAGARQRWERCRDYAHKHQNKCSPPPRLLPNGTMESTGSLTRDQERYERREGDFFKGIVFWVDHIRDYLRFLDARDGTSKEGVPAKDIILFLAASPTNEKILRLHEEAREIRDELDRSKLRDKLLFLERGAIRPKDLGRAILGLSPRYLHFSGHGSKAGAICIEDDQGRSMPLPTDALGALLKASGGNIQCVILNACWSATQAEIILSCVPFVIGMNKAIGDKAAIIFSCGFYRGIGEGKEVPKAFELGLAEMKTHSVLEYSTPELLKQ